jgi:hypothetical protein
MSASPSDCLKAGDNAIVLFDGLISLVISSVADLHDP